jgi:hypothetical protein
MKKLLLMSMMIIGFIGQVNAVFTDSMESVKEKRDRELENAADMLRYMYGDESACKMTYAYGILKKRTVESLLKLKLFSRPKWDVEPVAKQEKILNVDETVRGLNHSGMNNKLKIWILKDLGKTRSQNARKRVQRETLEAKNMAMINASLQQEFARERARE